MASLTRRAPTWYLPLGVALIALSQMRWGIGILAFAAPAPFLIYLRGTRGWRSRVGFAVAVFLAYTLALLKIITAPLPLAFAVAFALPFTVVHGAAFLGADAVGRRTGRWVDLLAFPTLMVIAEYLLHRFTEFGSWAAAAYTQVDNLPLLQVASLFGLAGVSFVVYLVGSGIAAVTRDVSDGRAPLAVSLAVLVGAVSFGSIRLGAATPGETVTVAAIGTDSTISGWPLPSDEELARVADGLFARTAQAAEAGARLVSWTEASTAVQPQQEPAFIARLQDAARTHQIDLVASYIVPHDETRTYENRYVWLRPDGSVDHTYNKHHPVPGEPTTPGVEAPKVVNTAAGRATGAICYDYDFPALSLAQARLGIDLAVVPSSDWRGIDPIHTQMASVRAIEGGFSLLRSTRWGLSAGYDAYGRVRGWESSFDTTKRVLVVGLPPRGIWTLYTAIGDAFVWACGLFAAGATVTAARSARRRVPAPGRTSDVAAAH